MSLKPEFDAHASNYQVQLDKQLKFFGAESKKYARRKALLIKDAVNEQEQNIYNILDFGCGTGVMTSELYSLFPNANIFGTDPSSKSLEIAIENSNPDINYLAPQALYKRRLQFNLIVAANVFHHIPFVEHLEQLKNLKKHLITGGYFFFFEHNPFNPLARMIVRQCELDKNAKLLAPNGFLTVVAFQIILYSIIYFSLPSQTLLTK
jgi:predicted TPR repeat methyltransferase